MNSLVYLLGKGSEPSLGVIMDEARGGIAQWLEPCYWGTLPEDDRYASPDKERDDFSTLMATG